MMAGGRLHRRGWRLGSWAALPFILSPLVHAAAAPREASSSLPFTFSDVWYREVFQGDVAGAAADYQRLYEAPGAMLELRRKAALRAGVCSEKLGDTRRAQAAYAWLVRSAPSGDALARDALTRWAQLRVLDLAGTVTSSGVVSSAVTSTHALERLRARVEKRDACAAGLKAELRRRSEQVRGEERLRRRLAELGVEVSFEGEGGSLAAAGTDGPEQDLDADDRELLRRELAERFYQRGLRTLRDGQPAAAAEELRKVLALKPEYLDAPEFLRAAQAYLQPVEGVAQRAALRLLERREARELATPEEVGAALIEAVRLEGQGHRPQALSELERARSLEEWAPPEVQAEPRLRGLVAEVDARAMLLAVVSEVAPGVVSGLTPTLAPAVTSGVTSTVTAEGASAVTGSVRKYEEARQHGRAVAGEIVSIAEEVFDLRWVSGPRRHVILVPALREERAETEAAEAMRRVQDELERLLASGEEQHRRFTGAAPGEKGVGDKSAGEKGTEGWRREFRDILMLTEWFPESDGDQRFRKLAQEYLAR